LPPEQASIGTTLEDQHPTINQWAWSKQEQQPTVPASLTAQGNAREKSTVQQAVMATLTRVRTSKIW